MIAVELLVSPEGPNFVVFATVVNGTLFLGETVGQIKS